jgi:hypothetical protein
MGGSPHILTHEHEHEHEDEVPISAQARRALSTAVMREVCPSHRIHVEPRYDRPRHVGRHVS